jgi:hypothetical protein
MAQIPDEIENILRDYIMTLKKEIRIRAFFFLDLMQSPPGIKTAMLILLCFLKTFLKKIEQNRFLFY